jgi:hypothetical protein
MEGDASCSLAKDSIGMARDGDDKKTAPCVEANTH